MTLLNTLRRALRRERTPADLARWLDEPEADLRQWLTGRPAWTRGFDYARFTIPKRRGGLRQIEAPSAELKALQRKVLRRLLNPLPQPPEVTGFVRGRSIVHNARPHVGRAVVINLDLADFFPGISAERVASAWRALSWDADASTILTRICTHDGRLPQGAPTSPALSNLVCRRLDRRLAALARHNRGSYTRYADDITLSLPSFGRNRRRRPWSGRGRKPAAAGQIARGFRSPRPGRSRSLLTLARTIIEEEGFRIQLKKRVRVQRPHQRQTATGLVVNQAVNLPRATRRLIRAMRHRAGLGQLDAAGRQRLAGLEALLRMVETQRGS
jgi:hypothetical protein